ncbi:MAG: YoaK family protein, partial [Mycobacteriales bacterium]
RWAVAALLMLTAATGLIDAVSYLTLGLVFVANMTGNVVFLGFVLNSQSGLTVIAPIVAVAGFLGGSALSGRAFVLLGNSPRHWLGVVFGAQAAALLITSLLVGVGVCHTGEGATARVLITVLAVCFGLQNGTVRRLAPRDLTTTVLTMTLTSLAADSVLGGGAGAKPHRRLGSVGAMLAGAGLGALLLNVTTAGVIVIAAVMVAAVATIFALAPTGGQETLSARQG